MADHAEAVTVLQCDRDAADEYIAALRSGGLGDGISLAERFARHRTQANETMRLREALRPLQAEIDRLGREYGFDRPDEQYQPLMLSMRDVKRIAALSGDSA